MKKIKTFQVKKRLKNNAGAGLNKIVCVVIVLIIIVLVCVGGFYWYNHRVLNPLKQSGDKLNSETIEGTNDILGGNSSENELVAKGLQVGDYVSYTPNTEARDYYGEIANWRVWKIEGDNVVIVPTDPLGDLTLDDEEDWLNAEEKIENECDKYVNSNLGITAENIRSMNIDDIEEVLPEEEVESEKSNCDYGTEYIYENGKFYVANADTDTFDGYNKQLSTQTTASSDSPVKLINTYWYNSSPTWTKLKNIKTGMTSDTYGTILGKQNRLARLSLYQL